MKKKIVVTITLIIVLSLYGGKIASAKEENISSEIVDWGMKELKVEQAHERGLTGKGVKIAILDTGVDIEWTTKTIHEDLKIAGSRSELIFEPDPDDLEGHGTHVTGIISAQVNGIGTIGVAPDAEIYTIKVANALGVNRKALVDALEWCLNNEIDIINFSGGFGSYYNSPEDEELRKKLDYVIERIDWAGKFLIAATGNGNKNHEAYDSVAYPAGNSKVIGVGSVNENIEWSTFSNYGEGIDFVAPGENVYSAWYGNSYNTIDGTSMATAHVSGIIALYKQKFPGYSKTEIIEEMKKNAIDLGESGYDFYYGYGLVQSPPIEASDIGKPLTSLVNNRFVLYKGTDYPSRLFDDNKNNYATMANNGEVVIRFENPIQPAGIEMLFRDKSSISNLRVTVYDKQRNPIQTLSVLEQGIYTYQNLTDDIYFVGLKNISGKAVELTEFEVLGQVESNPKKVMNFHTTLTLKKDLRWFMGEDFDLSDILPKLGVKDKTFAVDKGTDWDDNSNHFTKVRVTNEELGIVNKWVTVESGELSAIFNEDLTNQMYGQVIQSNGISSPDNLLDDWTLFNPSMNSGASQTYEFDNPVTISHMLALSTPSYLDNQLKLTLTNSNGEIFEEFIGDEELFYRYFRLSQTYENIKKVKLENLSKNNIYLIEIGYYGEPNEEVALPAVAFEHPITLKKSGFTLYDTPLAENPTKVESLENNTTIHSMKGYGYNTSKHVYDWLQIEWNGELKWIYNDAKEVDIKAIYNHGLIDTVGVGNPISKNVYSIYNLVNNGTPNASFPAKSSVEYPFNTPVSIKRMYLAHGEYIDNAAIDFLLELLDENKQIIYQKTITRDDLYKKLITFDETYENVKYFRLTNQTSAWHYLMEIDFK